MNSCGLAMMPFFAAFQYSACNDQAEKIFPDFQSFQGLILCFPSVLLTRVALSFPLILLMFCQGNVSVILKYHYNICSSDYIGL